MAYSCYALITIHNEQVAANESDFTVRVSGTYDGTGGEPDLRTVGNGGNIQNTANGGASGAVTVPADLVFSPNTDGSSPYDFEIEKYNAATGEIVAWVEVPSLSSSEDTLFYMVYGDDGVEVSQEDVNGTWEASFEAVYHLNNYLDDSTVNNHDGTNQGTDDAPGKIANGRDFIRANGDYITIYSSGELIAQDNITVELWVNPDSVTHASTHNSLYAQNSTDGLYTHGFYIDRATGKLAYDNYQPSGGVVLGDTALSVAAWEHVVITRSTNTVVFYKGGGSDGGGTGDARESAAEVDNTLLGARHYWDAAEHELNGLMDEVRISTIARDADYITTDFNTQNEPSTFYSMGAEQAAGGANYPVSLTLARIATASPSASAAALAGATLARIAAVSEGGMAATLASATLARQGGLTDGAIASALAAASLERQGSLTDVAIAAALGSMSLAREAAVTDAAVAVALASATLARQTGLTGGAIAAAAAAVSLARQGGLTDAAIAAAVGSSTLTRQADIAQGAGAAASAATTLARQSAIAEGGAAAADASLSVAIVKAAVLAATAAAVGDVGLAHERGISESATAAAAATFTAAIYHDLGISLGLAASLTLGRLAASTMAATAAAQANAVLADVLDLSLGGMAAASGAVNLSRVLEAVASALAAASATIAVARSLGIAQDGVAAEAAMVIALTLMSRDLDLTLDERSLALSLVSRALALTLQERD